MSGILVKYGGIAINSDKTFSVSADNKESFVKQETILDRSLNYKNIGNPCELYSVVLDGNVSAFPDNTNTENLGYWSNSISDDNGYFEEPINIELVGQENISSAGITITFDVDKEIFPTHCRIVWYNDYSFLSSKYFDITSAKFFFSNKVEFYNRVLITFDRLNMPKNRLKIQRVEFGLIADSDSEMLLKNAKVSRSLSPISSELPINTFNFSFASRNDILYAFQERQPIDVSFNDSLQGQFFVKSSKRTSKTNYDVNCEDFFGLLSSVDFAGGIYDKKNASELIQEIFNVAQISVIIAKEIKSETVTGHIAYTTCREALKQVLFAIQAVADTSNSTSVKIYKLNDALTQEIPLTRLMQGLQINTTSRVSSVELTAHTFAPTQNEQKIYDANKSGTGKNIFIKFASPLHSLTITNGTILKSGANFAIINADAQCVLLGKTYEHIKFVKSKENDLVLSTDTKNIKSISDATLVSPDKLDSILERCYNHLVKTETINAKIVEGKRENVDGFIYDKSVNIGDVVSVNTEYQGLLQGRVESQKYTLNGGILVKETVLR